MKTIGQSAFFLKWCWTFANIFYFIRTFSHCCLSSPRVDPKH